MEDFKKIINEYSKAILVEKAKGELSITFDNGFTLEYDYKRDNDLRSIIEQNFKSSRVKIIKGLKRRTDMTVLGGFLKTYNLIIEK